MEFVVEAAVSALMSSATTEIWAKARDRVSRALRPADPHGESATIDVLMAAETEASRRTALTAHFISRIREHPDRVDELQHSIGEIEQILIDAQNVKMAAQTVHLYGPQSEATKLTVMQAARAAHELEDMSIDAAITVLSAMAVDAAARRLALMRNAAELLSNMDERLAADLLTAMPRPAPSTLLRAIEPERAAAIIAETTIEAAVGQLAELSEVDPGGAAMLLFSMHRSLASQLLAELGPPHPAELFSRMVADRAASLLAAMDRDKAVWRISELQREQAAQIMSKMDKGSAVELFHRLEPSLSVELLERMVVGDGAEIISKMDAQWACSRMAKMPPAKALDLVVALRPPRNLVKEIDGDLALALLPAAVAALAQRAENLESIEAAQAKAARIISEAQAQAQALLNRASNAIPEQGSPVPTAPPAPTLGERIIAHLKRHSHQTNAKIARSLREPESEITAALKRLVASGYVTEYTTGRAGIEHYSLP